MMTAGANDDRKGHDDTCVQMMIAGASDDREGKYDDQTGASDDRKGVDGPRIPIRIPHFCMATNNMINLAQITTTTYRLMRWWAR